MKFFAWLLLIGLILWAAVIKKRKQQIINPAPTKVTSELMVQCHYCHVHLPASEAIHDGEHTFCCPEHQRAFHS
jgi:uncharacterized protein